MTRYLITSDSQIGAHPDYGRDTGDRLADDDQVWERVLAIAVEHKVDAVLHGGDVFQYRRPTPAHLMAFQRPLLAFLVENDIPVLAINGNHDVESPVLPSSIELFEPVIDVHTQPGVWTPSGNLFTPGEVAVVTLPWVPMSRLIASRNGGDRADTHAIAAQLLLDTARELRGQVDGPAVLLAHWHVDEAVAMSGQSASEIFHEPLLCYAELEQIGFDAMAFAHNHRVQTFGPNAFHIGSPQPIDFGEAASEHGVWIVDTAADTPLGLDTVSTFVPIESRPFVTLDLAPAVEHSPLSGNFGVHGIANFSGLVDGGWEENVADAVVRVRYTATEEQARRISHGEITKALYDAGAHRVYSIQPTILRENRARAEHVNEDIAPLAAVQAWCEAQEITSADWTRGLLDLTSTYLQEVGS